MTKHSSFVPHRDKVFVTELESGDRLSRGGIILADDDMTNRGIRPRWCQVSRIGEDVTGVEIGDWLLVEHGRWSFGIDVELGGVVQDKMWHIDYPDAVILKSKEDIRPTVKTTLNKREV